MGATAWAAGILRGQLEDTQGLSSGDVRWNTTSFDKLLVSLLIGAHLLENHCLSWRVLNDIIGDFVDFSDQRIAVICLDPADVLNVGTLREVVPLAWLQVGATRLGHRNVKQVTS